MFPNLICDEVLIVDPETPITREECEKRICNMTKRLASKEQLDTIYKSMGDNISSIYPSLLSSIKLFMFLGNGEKAGSGADIIRKGWNDNHWPAPELTERMQPDETMMTLQLVSNEKSQENKHDVGENVGDNNQTELTERRRLIIDELRKSPTTSAKMMSERMSVSPRTIERDLQKLTTMGVITHEGSDFGGEWKVPIVSHLLIVYLFLILYCLVFEVAEHGLAIT